MAAAFIKGIFFQISIGALGAIADLAASEIEQRLEKRGIGLWKDWEARKTQEVDCYKQHLEAWLNVSETQEALRDLKLKQQTETQERGFDIGDFDYGSFHRILGDLVDKKIEQADLRGRFLEVVDVPWITEHIATLFPRSVNGWEYFHWVVAQELAYHEPVAEIDKVLDGVRRRVPELAQYPAQNADDLFKYVLVNDRPKEKTMELMKKGAIPTSLGSFYAEYPDVAARLQAYLVPFPHVLV